MQRTSRKAEEIYDTFKKTTELQNTESQVVKPLDPRSLVVMTNSFEISEVVKFDRKYVKYLSGKKKANSTQVKACSLNKVAACRETID